MDFEIIWTSKSHEDILSIYNYISNKISIETAVKIIDEIYETPSKIKYPEQFQTDEYREDCRRIIVRNYKILYHIKGNTIYIIRIFNTYQNPTKSLL
ncbi:MAG: type II toxin-antitoxin system RelE/ParE family toxin [Flavobacterium sp.]|nr:type II toxin-antitoxin system RelE/ParE family toxin [Flavobacterium sp.]